ncbi:MAG: TlpA family protein disulfide reductase [Chloroflexi bacterium]|nr:TlpA family protein disulfide reductase [Chloroflexota bacterium]
MQPTFRRFLFIGILALGLIWTVVSVDATGSATAGKTPAPQKGFLTPEFTLQTLDGKSATISDLRGQVVLINFWASWCPPCRAEMPAIQNTYEEYREQGFTVLAVNMTAQDQLSDVTQFVSEYSLTFPILLDPDGSVAQTYQVRSLPTSFFVGRDGVIREVVIGGPMAEALIRSRVEELVQEQP